MILSLIVAVAENNAIGKNNGMPWYLPEDLKFFKQATIGKPVLMGRKTFESLGKPLPGRLNIVLSGKKDLQLPEGVLLCHTLADGVSLLRNHGADEAFVIGGGKVFMEAMSLVDRLYITRVHTVVADADTFFPSIDHTHWKLVWEERHQADEKNNYNYTFQKYERIEF